MTAHVRPRMIPLLIAALGIFAALKFVGVAVGVSTADAQTPSPADAAESVAPAATGPNDSPAAAVPDLAPGEAERRILERLAARRQQLDQREEDLKVREAVIAAAELKLQRRLVEFEREFTEIAALRAEREAAAAEEVEALVSAYERMNARDAAAIFNALDEDIMLAVAASMRTQALAGVLAEMDPDRARSLTVLLAKRGRPDGKDATDLAVR